MGGGGGGGGGAPARALAGASRSVDACAAEGPRQGAPLSRKLQRDLKALPTVVLVPSRGSKTGFGHRPRRRRPET